MRWVPGPESRVSTLGSRVSPMGWVPGFGFLVPGLESQVLPIVPGLGSHFLCMTFGGWFIFLWKLLILSH